MAQLKIWCLFSVENDYDQPEHNLRAWWDERPSIEKLADFFCCPLSSANDMDVVALVDIWKGNRAQLSGHGDTRWRLEEVAEGGV